MSAARYAVFGKPIAHSLSPRIHAMFGAQLGIALEYRAIEADRAHFPEKLETFAREGGRGANVTLPLKEDALKLCAAPSERARRCGSVNTLTREDGSWRGDSTDGSGFLRDLRARQGFEPRARRCLVLGAGGAARAVAFALADAEADGLAISNRTRERAEALASAIGAAHVAAIDWDRLEHAGAFDLVVNATAAGHGGASIDLPRTLPATGALCYDLSYADAARAFTRWARGAGAGRTSDGLGMLVEQAAESFAAWHGRTPDTEPVYAALRVALAATRG
jgi:shikimate dehydrogenase